MVTIGYGGFIPFVGFVDTATDYTLLGISLGFLMIAVIAAMKLDSMPFRITVVFVCFGATYPLLDYGLMYCVFAVLFGVAVIMRTVYDTFSRGAEV